MANLLYRTSTTPTTPSATSAKSAPLTNLEVDGNFKSVDNDLGTKVSTGNITQTVAGTKTFSNAVILTTAGTLVTHAVRADREISSGGGLTGGGNLTGNRTISLIDIAAGSATVGTVAYNGNTSAAGKFHGGATDPTATTRLNYDGLLRATRIQADTIGVGTSAPSTSGNMAVLGTISAVDFNSTSDARLKTNVTEISGLELLQDIRPVQFNWKDTDKKSYGVIAQEIEEILPELVYTDENGVKGVSYIPLIALLIGAVKTLDQRVKQLEV